MFTLMFTKYIKFNRNKSRVILTFFFRNLFFLITRKDSKLEKQIRRGYHLQYSSSKTDAENLRSIKGEERSRYQAQQYRRVCKGTAE